MSEKYRYHLTEEDRERIRKIFYDTLKKKKGVLHPYIYKGRVFTSITILIVILGVLLWLRWPSIKTRLKNTGLFKVNKITFLHNNTGKLELHLLRSENIIQISIKYSPKKYLEGKTTKLFISTDITNISMDIPITNFIKLTTIPFSQETNKLYIVFNGERKVIDISDLGEF